MQCKDIPDEPILVFLRDLSPRWATWFDPGDEIPPLNAVQRAMPDATPEKLVLAKMRMMIRKGTVDGCPCGCRGDFVITDKGRARLDAGADRGDREAP